MMKRTKTTSTLTALLVATTMFAAACGSDADSVEPAEPIASVPADEPAEIDDDVDTGGTDDGDDVALGAPSRVVPAAQGAEDRARNQRPASAELASTSSAADAPIGDCAAPYEPTAEEIAASNADAQGLADALERFGIAHTATTDDTGWLIVDYDGLDVIAQSVADSYWNIRFPVDGFEVDPDDAGDVDNIAPTDDETILDFPAPTAEDIEVQNAENARLADAFTAAGIEFELVADELGWQWLEWNVDDPAVTEAVDAVYGELYPVEILPVESCIVIDTIDGDGELGDSEFADGAPAPELDAATDKPVDEFPVPLDESDVDIAQRDAEVAALADGLAAAGVTAEVVGESPWSSVVFDITNDAAVPVVADILAAR